MDLARTVKGIEVKGSGWNRGHWSSGKVKANGGIEPIEERVYIDEVVMSNIWQWPGQLLIKAVSGNKLGCALLKRQAMSHEGTVELEREVHIVLLLENVYRLWMGLVSHAR